MKNVMEYFASSFVVRFTGPDCHDEPIAILRTMEAAELYVELTKRAFGTSDNVKFRITPLTIVH